MKRSHTDFALLILRIGFGVLMLVGHGLPKLKKLINGDFRFPKVFGMPDWLGLSLATFSEFLCAALVILGVKTRLATVPLIITMLIAAFVIHGSDGWFGSPSKELALLYLFPFLALFFSGPGKYSIDKM
ncbi:MAG: DoxX family protein [Saprospiraceae bacterium]|nr:DoxX family protein [Saprospiraceae bacterium]